MADEDAEIALLHQMQAGQDDLAWDDGAGGVLGGELPSNTDDSDQHVKEENFADDQVLRALSPSVTDPSMDGGEYEPLSPPSLPAAMSNTNQLGSRSSSRASERKPKTIGGFLADDSDDETIALPARSSSNGLLQAPAAAGPSRSVSRSPLNTISTPQDIQKSTRSQSIPSAVPLTTNAVSSLPSAGDHGDHTRQSVTAQMPISSAAPAGSSGNVPKARLPHDRAGILEDRIKEDPRGDLDAWLSLITEHRKRNKLDDARAVYERFFKVFPSAVSLAAALFTRKADIL